ncbi:hypothetical protein [Mycetocola spongiae]|uniref:hypothetical protein n=1 Tax=Mycetocola spongiae TaxID=2859226 RepID=UPI001CF0D653|nr:hypothetical protein [Mycetocola spongiae]UCR89486.1 hypothetical protein KXZ72_01945 [Mycetocola spongiae]
MRPPRRIGVLALIAIASALLPAAPAAATPAPSAVTSVELMPYVEGDLYWPSNLFPSFALRVQLDSEYARPGDSTTLTLPAGLRALAAPGGVELADGTRIADYAPDRGGKSLTVTFAPAVRDLRDLHAVIAVPVTATDLTRAGGTYRAEVTAGGRVFPVSANYNGLEWGLTGRVALWEQGVDPAIPEVTVLSLVAGDPELARYGGQWVAVGTAHDLPGDVTAIPESTRVFALDSEPLGIADLTAPAAELREGRDFSINPADSVLGRPATSVSLPQPVAGTYVISTRFAFTERVSLGDLPHPRLPAASASIFAPGTATGNGSVLWHDSPGVPGGGYSTLTSPMYLGSAGAEGSATAAVAEIFADRDVAEDRAGAEATLTVTNRGNVRMFATLTEEIGGEGVDLTLGSFTAERGTLTRTASGLTWVDTLEPGASALIRYRVDTRPRGSAPGRVHFSAAVGAESPSGSRREAAVAADELLIAGAITPLPGSTDPDPATTPGGSTPPAADAPRLAGTGLNPTVPVLVSVLLAAAGALLLLRRRRSA